MTILNPIKQHYRITKKASLQILEIEKPKRGEGLALYSRGTRKKNAYKQKLNDLIFKGFCLACYLSFLLMTILSTTALTAYKTYLIIWG